MTAHIPQNITVNRRIRAFGDPTVEVLVDGVPLEHAVSAAEPLSVELAHGQNPGVRITLAAFSVNVSDVFEQEVPADVGLGDEDDEPAAAPDVDPDEDDEDDEVPDPAAFPGIVDGPDGEAITRCGFVCDLGVSGGALVCSGAGSSCHAR